MQRAACLPAYYGAKVVVPTTGLIMPITQNNQRPRRPCMLSWSVECFAMVCPYIRPAVATRAAQVSGEMATCMAIRCAEASAVDGGECSPFVEMRRDS